MQLIAPKVIPPLDPEFAPAVLANLNFRRNVQAVGVRAVIGLERGEGDVSRFETLVYPEGHPDFDANYQYVERIIKFLLWQHADIPFMSADLDRSAKPCGRYLLRMARGNSIFISWANRCMKRNFVS